MTLSPEHNGPALGAVLTDDGCTFALVAPRAERVELAFVRDDGTTIRNVDMTNDNGTWRAAVRGVVAGQRYGYRVHGEWNPDAGLRANPAKLLVDPYARAVTAGVDYTGPIFDHTAESYYEPDTRDSAQSVPLSVVVADSPAPEPIARRLPLEQCVVYETHVKGFTIMHPSVPEHLRGRYAGLAYPAVIEHLTELGVNAIELLPIHQFVSEPFIMGRGLSNYWGYNTLAYFAPHGAYCSVGTEGDQVQEFKNMVSALHRAGIEVILDVVYNHTCEGSHEGPTLSFRGIDHKGYYRLTDDLRNDYDVTGCGNSVDTGHEEVLDLIHESLRYWVTQMGVDGFRFDLATTLIRDSAHGVDQNHEFKKRLAADPVFDGIKLIAEPWDMGPYGYQVGRWGRGWSEWNDRYRGYMRDYWRSMAHGVNELASRVAGSPDIFDNDERPPSSTINFIDAHDGFCLRDLVSYDGKHNEANGEDNRDGSDDNRSWNCGAEGETDDPGVNALRHRQVRNMLAGLIMSNGTPMFCAGDEMGRTQQGNNNAYCQDNQINWVHWDLLDQWADVFATAKRFIALRRSSPLLQADDYHYRTEVTDADGKGLGRYEMAWMNGYSGEMGEADWNDGGRRLLGKYVSNATDEAFLIWFYSGDQPVEVTTPPVPWGTSYRIVASTADEGELPTEALGPQADFTLPGRTVVAMRVTVPTTRAQVDELEGITTAPADAAQDGPAEQPQQDATAEQTPERTAGSAQDAPAPQ